MSGKSYIITILLILASTATAQWTCSTNADCSEQEGSVCLNAACQCPPGRQPALGGSRCVDIAPYHTSLCYEQSQCSRMFTGFECRRTNDTILEGSCHCQTGHHYFLGRCWKTVDFGEPCTRDEECLTVPSDPYSLTCSGTCSCADGYYQRQRGECRKIAYGVGERCVVNEDCQFNNGVCDIGSLSCVVGTTVTNNNLIASKTNTYSNTTLTSARATLSSVASAVRQHGQACESACPDPFVCMQGVCVCPVGYYSSETGTECYAELGSPSTAEQCAGLLAVVEDGVCRCPNNFFYEENMRDCVRMTRILSESCVNDNNCHTFGAMARCGEPDDNFGLRSCECDPEASVWDANRNMCRLFAGIGEQCQEHSDCLAGELEVQCVVNDEGQGYCACPEGLVESDGLCLTMGLGLNETCQASVECTAVEYTACIQGVCDCVDGYTQDNGTCAPTIGGICTLDDDCVIPNTVCVNVTDTGFVCQCNSSYVAYQDVCWPLSPSYGSFCNVTAQCNNALGLYSVCSDEQCICETGYHYRDGRCWPVIGLFQSCSRTSECFLGERSEMVVCMNKLCQCDFDFPYSEELRTCLSAASTVYISITLLLTSLFYTLLC